MKKLIRIETGAAPHWVGDGFPVRTIFTYQSLGEAISPFLLLDYAGPARFEPTDKPRGVEEHPHRGFETVTIVYQGRLEHRDSAGNHGTIGPGDVQLLGMATGESVACLNYLMRLGETLCEVDVDGVAWYRSMFVWPLRSV